MTRSSAATGTAIGRLARDYGAVGLLRLGQSALLGKRDGEVEARPCQMRIERDRAAIRGLGFAETRELVQRHAELVVQAGIVRPSAQGTPERGHCALALALHGERIIERDQRRCMIRIDREDPAQKRRTVAGTVGDEGGDCGQMQCWHMIRLCLQNLGAEHPRLIRPPRSKMVRRLPYNPLHRRIAHDTARPFDIRDAG